MLIVVPVLIFVAMNRVAFGAHFLSDVVLAWLITVFIMLLIWKKAMHKNFSTEKKSCMPRFLRKMTKSLL